MTEFPETWESLPEHAQRTLRAYLRDVEKCLGKEVMAVILYGSLARGDYLQDRSNINLLFLFDDISLEVLNRCCQLNRRWTKERIVTPLMLTLKEFRQFQETYPLEFFEIQDHHLVLLGRDPVAEFHLDGQYVFHECERGIRSNLLRLRQHYVEAHAQPEGIQTLLMVSLTTLIPCLRGLCRLRGLSSLGSPEVIFDRLPSVLDVDPQAFREVWLMKRGQRSPGKYEMPNLLNRYLETLRQVVEQFEAQKQEGRLISKP